MVSEGEGRPVEALIEALTAAEDNLLEVVAVLWTWLERNQRKLGSLRDKQTTIIRSVLESEATLELALEPESFSGVTPEMVDWLTGDPLRNAAELLVRIDVAFGEPSWPEMEVSRDIDGDEVVVALRLSRLVKNLGGAERPQSYKEYPTPGALAPSFLVCPLEVDQVRLEVLEPEDDPQWELMMRKLEIAVGCEEGSSLEVHLDTLGDHGTNGLATDLERRVARFDPAELSKPEENACVDAACLAVANAALGRSLLVTPELAVTPNVLEAISQKLKETDDAPLLTVVGMYHLPNPDPPDPDPLAGKTGWAEYVNEAIVLGPDGEERWRHCKLACAAAEVDEGAEEGDGEDQPEDGEELTEDRVAEEIYLGDVLLMVPSPLGTLAVVICLDTIAEFALERIAKCPANLLLVPSLSKTVFRHRLALQYLVKRLWGAAFVCNRWVEPGSWNEEQTRSFWVIDHREPEVPDAKAEGEHPSFVFVASKHKKEKASSTFS